MAEWAARWQDAIGATWLAEATTPLSPLEIAPVLTILQDLDKLIQRKADLDHRIDGMRKDQLAFAATVRTLAEKLAIAASDEPLIAAQTIRDRLAGAERQEALFRRLSDENDARTAERRALGESQERHDAQKRGILDLFESSSLLEVGAHLETVKARQRLRERIAEAETDLAARLGVGRADEAEMLLSAVDADGLRLEMAACSRGWNKPTGTAPNCMPNAAMPKRRWPPSVAAMPRRISRKSAARCLRKSRSGQPPICGCAWAFWPVKRRSGSTASVIAAP
jgi:uncharacterized protein YhaN